MSKFSRLLVGAGLALLCIGPATAQDLYFRNKPFKGPTSGSWDSMMVGLKEAAQVFELPLKEEGGVYLVGASQAAGATSGQVVVEGKVVGSQPGETGPLVNLKEFAAAAGLTYKPNREMGGIDVAKPVNRGGASGSMASSPGTSTDINKSDPGALVDLEPLIGSGYVILYMYKQPEPDKGYKASYNEVDGFASAAGVTVYKINVGNRDTPLGQKYPGMLPRMMVYRGRMNIQTYNGHSINTAAKDPEKTMTQLRKKWDR